LIDDFTSVIPVIPVAGNAAELGMLLLKDLNHHEHLGQTLLKKNLIQPESLRQALRIQQANKNRKLGDILVDLGAISRDEIQSALMEDANLMQVHLEDFDIDIQVLGMVPATIAKDLHLIPLMFFKDALVIAVAEIPEVQERALLRFTVDHRLIFVRSGKEEIDQAIHQWYPEFSDDMELENLEQSTSDLIDEQRIWSNADQLAKKAPLVRLVDSVIRDAVHQHASDIHFRPSEKYFDLLFRIDGTLITIRQFKIGLLPAVVSRIKILSRLNIAEHRIPQDGRIKIKEAGNNIDLRISIIPMQFGESIVIRVLNKNEGLRSIDQIGFDPVDKALFHDLINRSYGIILVTGPTGSGKSTTLYAALQEVSRDNLNIITVEDPIEYELPNTRQIQLEQHINFGFPQALRHILRHDPDIIMIGEMRDLETCKIAIESALTGHLVLSTLHTNDAPSALIRLMEIGIAPYMIQSAVIGVLAQRLVRCNCPDCLSEETVTPLIRSNLQLQPDEKFYRSTGCRHCHFTGFSGRMAIYELMVINNALRNLIQIGTPSEVLRAMAVNNGMITMPTHGIQQARLKKISIAEVYRSCM